MKKLTLVSISTAVLMLVSVANTSVGAVGNQGPDPNDFEPANNRSHMHFEVAKRGGGSYLHSPNVQVVLYMPSSSGTIVVYNGRDLCAGTDTTANGAPTTFTFTEGTVPAVGPLITSIGDNSMSCNNYNVSVSGLDPVSVGDRTFYPVSLDAVHTGSSAGVNAFKITVPSGGYVSYYSFSGTFTIQDRSVGVGDQYSDFYLKAGFDCTTNGPHVDTFTWWDDDHYSAGGNWNQRNGTLPEEYRMVIEEFPYGSSSFSRKWALRYNGNVEATGWPVRASSSAASPPGVPINGHNSGWRGDGAGAIGWVQLETRPGYRYVWRWMSVKDSNGVQFQLPFNSIYYDIDCTDGQWDYTINNTTNITARSGSDYLVSPGETFEIRSRVRNNGSNATAKGANYNHVIRTLDSGVYDADVRDYTTKLPASGDRVASNQYDFAWWAGDNPGLNLNQARTRTGSFRVNNDAPDGTRFCFYSRVNPARGYSGVETVIQGARDTGQICFRVDDPPALTWNYQPRFLTGTTSSGATLYPGDIIEIRTDGENTQSGTGVVHEHAVRVNAGDEPFVTGISANYSGVISGTNGRFMTWPSEAAIGGFGNSRDKVARFRINNGVAPGTQICIRARLAPRAGTSTPPPPRSTDDNYRWVQRCFNVADAGGWNYNPRFLSGTTPAGATLSQGDFFTIQADATNSGTGTGAQHGFEINLSTNSGYAYESSNSGGGSVSGDAVTWTPLPGIPIGATGSANRAVTYRLNNVIPASVTQICATVSVWPNAGTLFPTPVATDNSWDVISRCFNVDASEYYNHSVNVDIPSRVRRQTTFNPTTRITNNPTAGQTTAAEAFDTATNVSRGNTLVSRSSGGASPSGFGGSGDTYTWYNSSGLALNVSQVYTSGYRVNNGAALGRVSNGAGICVTGNVSPAAGIVGGATSDASRFDVDCADVYDTFNHTINSLSGVSALPGETINFSVRNIGNGPSSSATGYVVSHPGPTPNESGNLGSIDGGGTDTAQGQFTIPTSVGLGSYCVDVTVTPDTGDVYNALGTDVDNTSGSETENLCVTILEQPYLIVQNADVWAGGVIATQADWISRAACSGVPGLAPNYAEINSVNNADSGRGSYAEYGVYATGPGGGPNPSGIYNFGSNGIAVGLMDDFLTFANTISPNGNLTNDGRCITNFYGLLDGNAAVQSSVDLNVPGVTTYNVNEGDNDIFRISGNVTIGDDVVYSNYSVGNIGQIPFFMLVVDGDINIRGNVSRLDGFYMATGTINTCTNAPPYEVGHPCDNQLTVNGSFVANKIEFNRAAGGLLRDGPAELFIHSPEMFLGAPDLLSDSLGDFGIEQFRDLPPVYSNN